MPQGSHLHPSRCSCSATLAVAVSVGRRFWFLGREMRRSSQMKLRCERNERNEKREGRDWAKLSAGSAVWEDQDLPDVQRGSQEWLHTLVVPPLSQQELMKQQRSRDEMKGGRKK